MIDIKYRIVINSQSMIGRYQFQLQKIADGGGYEAADRITVINGAHTCVAQ